MIDTQYEMNYYHLTNFDDRVILVVFLSFLESHKKHNKKVNGQNTIQISFQKEFYLVKGNISL